LERKYVDVEYLCKDDVSQDDEAEQDEEGHNGGFDGNDSQCMSSFGII